MMGQQRYGVQGIILHFQLLVELNTLLHFKQKYGKMLKVKPYI